jgi:hypothetical protein
MRIAALLLAAVAATGCSSFKGPDTLGNGTVDVGGVHIPVTALAAAADKIQPGAGSIILSGDSQLMALTGNGPRGPWGKDIPFRTEYSGTLKDGTRFESDDIADLQVAFIPEVQTIVQKVDPKTLWGGKIKPPPADTPTVSTNISPAVLEALDNP